MANKAKRKSSKQENQGFLKLITVLLLAAVLVISVLAFLNTYDNESQVFKIEDRVVKMEDDVDSVNGHMDKTQERVDKTEEMLLEKIKKLEDQIDDMNQNDTSTYELELFKFKYPSAWTISKEDIKEGTANLHPFSWVETSFAAGDSTVEIVCPARDLVDMTAWSLENERSINIPEDNIRIDIEERSSPIIDETQTDVIAVHALNKLADLDCAIYGTNLHGDFQRIFESIEPN